MDKLVRLFLRLGALLEPPIPAQPALRPIPVRSERPRSGAPR